MQYFKLDAEDFDPELGWTSVRLNPREEIIAYRAYVPPFRPTKETA